MSPAAIAAVAAGLLVAALAAAARPQSAGRMPGGGPARRQRRWRPGWSRRQAPPPTEAWVALLDALAADVRAGASLRVAWATSAAWPAGAALHRDAFPADDAPLQHSPRSADETVVVHAVRVATELGGPVAATLDAAAALLRERLTARAEALAHAAQARLSARVLTAVPLVFAGWSALTSGSFRAALLSPAGAACALGGGLLNLTGWAWMRRLVRIAARGDG